MQSLTQVKVENIQQANKCLQLALDSRSCKLGFF
jgi:hypothetical protein